MVTGARHLLDIALGTLLLRVVVGWLLSRHVLRRLAFLAAIVAVSVTLIFVDLPVSRLAGGLLLVPLTLGLLWSSIPDFAHAIRALVSGRPWALRPQPAPESDPAVAALLEALVELARSHTGALIIRPRLDDVTPFLSGGEEVSAEVNRSLLLSIFHPGAPRHDGAVVIEAGRIVRIGAVMPLASAEAVPSELGTRHLAALGLSEQTDADILVVSEERGIISRVSEGRLTEVSVEDAASADRLGGVLDLSEPRLGVVGGRGRSALLWLAAGVLAVAGSMGADGAKRRLFPATQEIAIVTAPIGVVNVPAGYFVADLSATSCQMYVATRRQGPTLGLQDPPKVVVDSKDLPPGDNHISLMASMTQNLRPGWRVERFEPPEISFTLARERTLVIPIVPAVASLNRKWEARAVRARPGSVRAQVRDATWRARDHLETLPVDLSTIEAPGIYTFEGEINLPASIEIAVPRKVTVIVEVAAAAGPGAPRAAMRSSN